MEKDEKLLRAVRLAKKGDVQGFEDLYNLTYQYAFFHARAIVHNEEEAWDLLQEVYIAVYQGIKTLREEQYVKSWIGGIVFNLGHKKLRKKTEVLIDQEDEFLFDTLEELNKDTLPEDALDYKETVQIVREAVDGLPQLQKAAVLAYYYDEKAVDVIAQEAGCSSGTIKSRLNYARKAMKECLEKKEKQMGVALHSITGPVILLAFREMFTDTFTSPEKANLVLCQVESCVGIASVATTGGAVTAVAEPIATISEATIVSTASKAGIAGIIKSKIAWVAIAAVTGVGGVAGYAGVKLVHEWNQTQESELAAAYTEETIETVAETILETTAAPKVGWIEEEGGWRYYLEDSSYVAYTWKEIDGSLYYFQQNGIMAQDKLYQDSQVFLFHENGTLIGIEEAEKPDDSEYQTYVAEEARYYARKNSIFRSNIDGTEETVIFRLENEGSYIYNLSVEQNIIYFLSEQGLYSVTTDGNDYQKLAEESWWWSYSNMSVKDGEVYFTWKNSAADDNEQTGIYKYEAGRLDMLDFYFGETFECAKMQAENDWVYMVRSVRGEAEVCRMQKGIKERLVDGAVDEFFVYGDTLYYMQNGELLTKSISETTKAQGEERELISRDIPAAYQRYVNDILVPKYGRLKNTHIEYGYKLIEESEDYRYLLSIPLQVTGIVGTHLEDMDDNGVPELLVFRLKADEEATALVVDFYHIDYGYISLCGERILASGMYGYGVDEEWLQVYIKDFGNRKALGVSHEQRTYVSLDGASGEMKLFNYDKAARSIYSTLDLSYLGTDGPMQDEWMDGAKFHGFEVSAERWDWASPIWEEEKLTWGAISVREPDCNFLMRSDVRVNSEFEQIEQAKNSGDLSAIKVVGDIKWLE